MADRTTARSRLATKFKRPDTVVTAMGADRFTEVAQANAGGRTKTAKVRAFASLPAGWSTTD